MPDGSCDDVRVKTVPAASAGGPLRIVRRLQTIYPEESATRLKRAVTEGQVTVDGSVVNDPGAIVSREVALRWDRNLRKERRVQTSLVVLYEDDDAIAVFKPSGLLTHPTEAKEIDTLLSRVSAYVQRRHGGSGERTFVSVVHRLDKETSGILVFARSRRGLVGMQAQLRAHTMDRRYRAVVEGDMTGDAGTYDRDLVAEPGERRRGVAKPGEPGIRAVTEWTVIERFGIATLVEARLKTGRTHQIRIHFANAGHVLVGDSVYRDRKEKPFPVPFPRQALHAGHLGWKTAEGKAVSLDADPPGDFLKLLEELRKRKRKK
jgi:23S rRNA pseudouridine1911/1915/1917 synthase